MAVGNAAPVRYDPVAQALHWGMFLLVTVQWIDGKIMDDLARGGTPRALAFGTHESLGLLILILVIGRAFWRAAHPPPPLEGPAWQRYVARLAHALLYLLLIALPVTGYLTFSAQGHATTFFGLVDIPAALARDRATARSLQGIHELLGDALLIVVALHAIAALWHHVFLRDETLRRMLPRRAQDG